MVSLTKLNKVLNFVLLQTLWFALVVGVAYQHIWLGVGFFILFAAWQLHPVNRKQSDLKLALSLAALGSLLDSLWLQLDLISYQMHWPYSSVAPIWIVMLWFAFGLTINHSLAWIYDYKIAGVLMGAIGGPISYLAAQEFGAVTLNQPLWAFVALSFGWALVMIVLVTVFAHAPNYQKQISEKREASWN